MQYLKANFSAFNQKPDRYLKILSILLVAGVALIVRLHDLNHESLWMDELRQTAYYPHAFMKIIDNAASQSQPPLDYWIGHLVQFVSAGDFAVRLPAALFGAGSIAVLMVLIAVAASWQTATGFGLIAALMPFNLYYAQEARPYAIAVCLFLCQLWALQKLMAGRPQKGIINAALLLFFSTAFLHSRSLFPLVLTICYLAILPGWLILHVVRKKSPGATPGSLIVLAWGTLILAFIFYLPALKFVLSKSGRYVVETSVGLNLENLLTVIGRCELLPIWQAYVVQSEPLTYPLLLLAALAPLFALACKPERKRKLALLVAILLPLAGMLNLFIFQAKSSMPFRPAYASYILPLMLILGSITFQGLWELAPRIRFIRTVRTGLIVVSVVCLFQTVQSAGEYKLMPRKTDWRGVSDFMANSFDDRHLIIFDSLSHFGAWEPTFYGFPRYYSGHSPLESMARLPMQAAKFQQLSIEPVMILFQWREYFLTPHSRYPILSVPRSDMKRIDYQQLNHNAVIEIKEFTGFSIIQLKRSTGNLARDTYLLIEQLLLELPAGDWLIELHLAAASLARAMKQDGWQIHLELAEKLAGRKNLPQVSRTANRIRAMQ